MSIDNRLITGLQQASRQLESLSSGTDNASIEKRKTMEVAVNIFKNMLQQLSELKISISRKL